MKYVALIRLDPTQAPDGPSDQLMTDMFALLDEMKASGAHVLDAGLHPIEEAVTIRQRRGRQKIVDGPFTEAKEVIGGFLILEAASKEEAASWASRFLAVHGEEWDIEIEVRQLANG